MKKKYWLILFLVAAAAAVALWYFNREKKSSGKKSADAKLLAEYNHKVNTVNLPMLQAELESKLGKKVIVEWSTGVVGGPRFTLTEPAKLSPGK